MPRVELRLFGNLREFLPDPKGFGTQMAVPEGSTVGGLLDRLGIPPRGPKIILVNGIHSDRDRALAEGDRVSVFPPIAGG